MKSVFFLMLSLSTVSAFAHEFTLVRTGSARITVSQETGEGDLDIAVASNNFKHTNDEDSVVLSSILANQLQLGKIAKQLFLFQSSNPYSYSVLPEEIKDQIDRKIYGSTQIEFFGKAKFEAHETSLKTFSCTEVSVRRFLRRSETIVSCDTTFESTITGSLH